MIGNVHWILYLRGRVTTIERLLSYVSIEVVQMRKRSYLSFALIFFLAFFSLHVSGQDFGRTSSNTSGKPFAYSNYYIGVGGGYHYLSIDGGSGVNDNIIDFNEADFAYKLYGGRRFSKHFGLELSVVDYGEPEGSVFDVSGVDDKLKVDEWGTTLHAVGYIPHGITNPGSGEFFEIFGKAGPAWVDSEGEAEATISGNTVKVSAEDSGFGGSFGIGTNIYLTSHLVLRAEGETLFWLDQDADTERYLGFVGLQYHFGS